MAFKIKLDLTFLLYHSSEIFYSGIIILPQFPLVRQILSLTISETGMRTKFFNLTMSKTRQQIFIIDDKEIKVQLT